ncbi:hypothetical protein AXF42_Ash011482 [Apostasia shenzhenica]|uniref:Uncharacterized protein n=1 Tax=Apostasia shenzhenica TaxID=1088818 RepID=A0A2I0BAR6_9ASPA|nr:hypothetical protein AXF42_Ash011482 [Apostasia shenzhenica]
MVQKLSTRQPSLEIRAKVTKEIAMERGIRFELIGSFSEDSEVDQNSIQQTDSVTMNQEKFRDVGSAAQAAFESATCAAAAAKAAVELLRSESQGQLEHLVGNAESTTKKKPIQKGSGNGCHSPLSASSSSDSNGFSLEREKKEEGVLFDGSESDMEKKNAAGDEEDVDMEMESPEQEDEGSSRVCPAPIQSFLAADNALVRSNPSSVRTRR